MTKCNECDIVDLGFTEVKKGYEIYHLCPNCGANDSVVEVDEIEWIENIESELN